MKKTARDAAPPTPPDHPATGLVRVCGAREHNLKNVDLDIPRDALIVFASVSGSGKSSLAFGEAEFLGTNDIKYVDDLQT